MSLSASPEALLVWQWFADRKPTVAYSKFVARRSCVTKWSEFVASLTWALHQLMLVAATHHDRRFETIFNS